MPAHAVAFWRFLSPLPASGKTVEAAGKQFRRPRNGWPVV